MLSGKNREAGREALQLKVRDASIEWLQSTYEEMCKDHGEDVDEEIMADEEALRAQWDTITTRTQYAACLS